MSELIIEICAKVFLGIVIMGGYMRFEESEKLIHFTIATLGLILMGVW